jgi:hypothetical protein
MPTDQSFVRRRRGGLLLLGAVALGSGLGAMAAALYVNVDRLDVVDKKRAVAKTVATVDRGTPLNVIAKEGRWYKVEVGGKEGYVAETVVSEKPQGKRGQSVALSAVKDGSIPALETAAAVKGVNPGAQQYASGKGYSVEGLRTLQARREAITPAEFDRFLAEGGFSGTAAAEPAVSPDESATARAR